MERVELRRWLIPTPDGLPPREVSRAAWEKWWTGFNEAAFIAGADRREQCHFAVQLPEQYRALSKYDPTRVSCSGLITDPVMALSDRSRSPDHVCRRVAKYMREEWAAQHAYRHLPHPSNEQSQALSAWLEIGVSLTIPVGRKAIDDRVGAWWLAETMLGGHSYPSEDRFVDNALSLGVFEEWEEAHIMIVAEVGGTTVEVFFLVDQRDPEVRLGRLLSTSPIVHGFPTDTVIRLIKQADAWWRRMDLGDWPPLKGGRPRTDITYSAAGRAYERIIRRQGQREMEGLRDALLDLGYEVSERTLFSLKARWMREGKTWPPRDGRNARTRTVIPRH